MKKAFLTAAILAYILGLCASLGFGAPVNRSQELVVTADGHNTVDFVVNENDEDCEP
jgi:hypothetical protein